MSTQNTHTTLEQRIEAFAKDITGVAKDAVDTNVTMSDIEPSEFGLDADVSEYMGEVTVTPILDEYEAAGWVSTELKERVDDMLLDTVDIDHVLKANGLKLVAEDAQAGRLSPIKVIDDLITSHEAAKDNTKDETVGHMQEQLRLVTRIDMLKQVRQSFEANGIQ